MVYNNAQKIDLQLKSNTKLNGLSLQMADLSGSTGDGAAGAV